MINLFDENIVGVKKELINGISVFTIQKSLEQPVYINNVDESIKVVLEEGCSLSLLEKDVSKGNVEYCLKNGSVLKHNLLVLDKGNNSNRHIVCKEGAIWDAVCADFSDGSSNFVVRCELEERDSKGYFRLSALSKNSSEKVFDVNFTHNFAHTESKMENYGVCRDASSLSFVGSSHIKNGSKKSIANQIAKIMVFDKKCSASASPILKIDENDVSASHGAAEGKINEDHLFYLMSRGIKEEDAKRLITLGYLNPILPYLFDEETRKDVEKAIIERL